MNLSPAAHGHHATFAGAVGINFDALNWSRAEGITLAPGKARSDSRTCRCRVINF